MDSDTISRNLLKLRKANEFTQEQVSKKIHITRPTYANYEKGKRSPSLNCLIALADFYEISVDDLIGHIPSANAKKNGLTREEKKLIKLYRMFPELLQKEFVKILNIIFLTLIKK